MCAVYRKRCDNCDKEFKRGLRVDLVINEVTVLSGDACWDTQDDLEFFAMFCSKECLINYLKENMDVTEEV